MAAAVFVKVAFDGREVISGGSVTMSVGEIQPEAEMKAPATNL